MAALSQREKYIAIGVGAAIAIFLANQFLWVPYEEARTKVDKDSLIAVKQMSDAGDLISKRKKLDTMVKEMSINGLQTDTSLAESQAINALNDWARDCRVSISAINPERWTAEGAFTAINFHVTAVGSTAAISRLMHAIESSTLPVRVSEMSLKSTKEQTDELQLQMTFSTLCITSDLKKKPKTGTGGVSASATASQGGAQ